jgi:hypothetical protein
MKFKNLFFLFVLWSIPRLLFATDVTYSVPGDKIKERLKEMVEYTQQSIDICVHDFASLGIGEYLEAAKNKGIRIRVVILEQNDTHVRGALADALFYKDFDARALKLKDASDQIQDFITFDDKITVTGPYNWLAYNDRCISDDARFSYDSKRTLLCKETFGRLFMKGEAAHFLRQRKEYNAAAAPVKPDTGFVLPGAEQATKTDKQRDEKEKAVGVPVLAQEEASREMIVVTIEELDKQFGKKSALSRSIKNTLWKKYKGKYVRWCGVVAYKGMGRVDWNRVGIRHQNNEDLNVEVIFDWRMFGKVLDLKPGSNITYTGRLLSRPAFSAPYRLDDGIIE